MSENHEQYFVVQLFTKIDFSDTSLLNFKREKGSALTAKEYSNYLTSNRIASENAHNLISFFIEYDNGAFMPEKCDAYEPIKDKFSKDNVEGPLRWLSQPGGALFLRKTKAIKYQGRIENHRFAPVWQEGKFLEPKVKEPEFLGEIVLYIEINSLKKKPSDYLLNFLLQLARCVNASYGLVALEEEYTSKQFEAAKVNEDKLPEIFWINYFGSDYASYFGEERLSKVSDISKKNLHDRDFAFMVSEDAKYYLNDKVSNDVIAVLGEENFNRL